MEKTLDSELLRLSRRPIESISDAETVLSMQVRRAFIIHRHYERRVSLLLAETAASIGAVMRSDLTRVAPVGVEINANHLRAVSCGKVTAEATSVYHGKTISVWQIEIKDERQRLVCVSRCTIALRKGGATMIDKK